MDNKDVRIVQVTAALAQAQLATTAAAALLEKPPSDEFDIRACLSRHSKGNEWEHFPAVRCRDAKDETFADFVMLPETQQRVTAALTQAGRLLPVSSSQLEKFVADYVVSCLSATPPRLDHILVVLLGAHTTVGSEQAEGGWPTPVEIIVTGVGGAKQPYRFLHCKSNEKQKGRSYERLVPVILNESAAAECTMEVLKKVCEPRLIGKAVFTEVARHFKETLALPFKSHEKDTTNLSRQLLATRMWYLLQQKEHSALRRLSPRGLTAWINVILGHRRRSRDWAAYVYAVSPSPHNDLS